jgi:hypothetical protein
MRPGSRAIVLLAAGAAALSGCQRQFAPAPFGTPLDEACNPMNGNLTVPLDTFTVGSAVVPVTKGWFSRWETPQDLTLTRFDTELNVWQGRRFIFDAAEPRNSVRCKITRGDTTISIQATRLSGISYRVDATWQPMIDGQYFYMQLQTRYVEQLKAMRGIIEAASFPVDSARTAKK